MIGNLPQGCATPWRNCFEAIADVDQRGGLAVEEPGPVAIQQRLSRAPNCIVSPWSCRTVPVGADQSDARGCPRTRLICRTTDLCVTPKVSANFLKAELIEGRMEQTTMLMRFTTSGEKSTCRTANRA